jgi:hypothetical protein
MISTIDSRCSAGIQEADINAIPGLDKFAKGRLMRGLQAIVPNFLVAPYHNKPEPPKVPVHARDEGAYLLGKCNV